MNPFPRPWRLERWAFLMAAGIFSAASASFGVDCPPPPVESSQLEDWLDWRDDQIQFLLEPFDCEGEPCIEIMGAAARAGCIWDRLEESRPTWSSHPRIAAGLTRLQRFAGAVSWQALKEHEMGFPIPDLEYLDKVRDQIEIPPLLRSQDFLKAVSHPQHYADAQRMLDEANQAREPHEQWVSLFYQSRFIETPDQTTHGRLLVWIPGNPEKWIQFGIITPEMDPDTVTHGLSIVSLLKQPDGGTRTAIIDYWREQKEDRIEVQTKVEAGEGGANCYNCHKSGVIPIRPHRLYALNRKGALIPDTGSGMQDRLEALNDRIKTFGPPDFGFGFDTEAYGPSVGPPDRERSLEDIQQWIRPIELSDASLQRVRRSMKCAGCHTPSSLGRLNYPSALVSDHDFVDLIHPDTGKPVPLLKEFITQGWMPPHETLNPLEREALYRALMQEYLDLKTGSGLSGGVAETIRHAVTKNTIPP